MNTKTLISKITKAPESTTLKDLWEYLIVFDNCIWVELSFDCGHKESLTSPDSYFVHKIHESPHSGDCGPDYYSSFEEALIEQLRINLAGKYSFEVNTWLKEEIEKYPKEDMSEIDYLDKENEFFIQYVLERSRRMLSGQEFPRPIELFNQIGVYAYSKFSTLQNQVESDLYYYRLSESGSDYFDTVALSELVGDEEEADLTQKEQWDCVLNSLKTSEDYF
jgi:hypothetical protein